MPVFNKQKWFSTMKLASDPIAIFQEKTIPKGTRLTGWAVLVHNLALPVPVRRPSCVSEHHVHGSHRVDGAWSVFDKRYWPGDTFADHLTFALRHENIDLLILKRIFEAVSQAQLEAIVRAAPTGIPARRAWYLYEILTGRTLDVEYAPGAAAIDVLDSEAYFTGKPRLSKRHRVRDNLLGTGRFCPIIRRTKALTEFLALDLAAKARDTVGHTGAHLSPAGVCLGERDRHGDPLPEFIGARPDDLDNLMGGLLEANDRMRDDGIDPVLKAAATAFGFVYVHPFQDGNGRMHRFLIHHVLAERKFTPPGLVFPVSSVMLDRIDDYRTTLQAHSGPLMAFIEWRATADRHEIGLNQTADLYRYFDCTEEAEFLYACVSRTVEHDLPCEIDYLRRHDEATRRIMDAVEMPDRVAGNLVMFIRQNKGVLSRKRREGEFQKLRDDEVALLEAIVNDAFEGYA